VLTAMVSDTHPDTVARLLRDAQGYARAHFNDTNVVARVAGGSIGIAGAFNESIGFWLVVGTLLSTAGTYVAAAAMLRSVTMPVLLVLPLLVASILWLALMQLLGVEINSNTTTSLAIASGVGVDAEVYLLFRFREELLAGREFKEALVSGFTLIRRALIASNAALIIGCWSLIPIPLYVGYVGFGMGLILLLAFIASFVISPVLWSVFRPAYLLSGIDASRSEGNAVPTSGAMARSGAR
jgi:predicted RND superfamily exporter protein